MTVNKEFILLNIIRQQLQGVSWSTFVIMSLTGVVLVMVWGYFYRRITGRPVTLRKKVWLSMAVIYLCLLFQITYDRRDGETVTGVNLSISFGNLQGDWLSAQTALYNIMNIVMFVPWGILATGVFSHKKAGKSILFGLLVCLVTTIGIESLQLIFNKGLFDLNDILMNMIGGFIGAIFFIGNYHLIQYGGRHEEIRK